MKQDYFNKQFVLQQSNQSRTKQYYYYNTASYSRGQSYIHWAYIFNQVPQLSYRESKNKKKNFKLQCQVHENNIYSKWDQNICQE